MPASREIPELLTASLEEVVATLYSAAFLRWLYNFALAALAREMPHLAPPELRDQPPPEGRPPNKRVLVALTLAVLRDRTAIQALYARLPGTVQEAIRTLAWTRKRTLAQLEAQLDTLIAMPNPEQRLRYYQPFVVDESCQFLCVIPVRERYWSGFHANDEADRTRQMVAMPETVRCAFREIVPAPPELVLVALPKPPAGKRLYDRGLRAVNDVRLVAEYVQQGHLRQTVAQRVLPASLRHVLALTGGNEFYEPGDDKDLSMLRTRLLTAGVAHAKPAVRDQLLNRPDDAQPVAALFRDVATSPDFLSRELLMHLMPPRTCSWNGRANVADVLAFFATLPPGAWVAWPNVQRHCELRELSPTPYARDQHGIRVRQVLHDQVWQDTVYVGDENQFEMVAVPLLQGFAFLMAAFGLAEIAYANPAQEETHLKGRPYLTPFSGLAAVRLTSLGEYVLGKRATVALAEQPARAAIALDERRLLATCAHIDPLSAMSLGKFMEKLAEGVYHMTHASLLGGCTSGHDIEERIKLFRRVVCAQPPPVWEQFFETTLARISPLRLESDRVVLGMRDSAELRHLFATDAFLRAHVLKVEGLRIAVHRGDLHKVVKRLEHFGYLIPTLDLHI